MKDLDTQLEEIKAILKEIIISSCDGSLTDHHKVDELLYRINELDK
jgi:hypothetical protein